MGGVAQQLAVAVFLKEPAGFDATPVQFAILIALMNDPGEDQVTDGEAVATCLARAVRRAQARFVSPLDATEREQLRLLLGKRVAGHEKNA